MIKALALGYWAQSRAWEPPTATWILWLSITNAEPEANNSASSLCWVYLGALEVEVRRKSMDAHYAAKGSGQSCSALSSINSNNSQPQFGLYHIRDQRHPHNGLKLAPELTLRKKALAKRRGNANQIAREELGGAIFFLSFLEILKWPLMWSFWCMYLDHVCLSF